MNIVLSKYFYRLAKHEFATTSLRLKVSPWNRNSLTKEKVPVETDSKGGHADIHLDIKGTMIFDFLETVLVYIVELSSYLSSF